MTDSPLIPLVALTAVRQSFWREMVVLARVIMTLHEHQDALEIARSELAQSTARINILANYLDKVDLSDEKWAHMAEKMAMQFDQRIYTVPFPGSDGLVGPEGVERE